MGGKRHSDARERRCVFGSGITFRPPSGERLGVNFSVLFRGAIVSETGPCGALDHIQCFGFGFGYGYSSDGHGAG